RKNVRRFRRNRGSHQRRTTDDYQSDRAPRRDFAQRFARQRRAQVAKRRPERFPECRRPRNSRQLDVPRKIVRRGQTARVRPRLPGRHGLPSPASQVGARILTEAGWPRRTVAQEKVYFFSSARVRWSLKAVVRRVSGTFLLVVRRFRSTTLSIGSMCRLTSSGVLGLLM